MPPSRPDRRLLLALALTGMLAGCGGGDSLSSGPGAAPARLPADYLPLSAGRGPRYRLPARSARVARREPVAGLRCRRAHPPSFGIHLELYAGRQVVPVAAGIGIAPPLRRAGVYVLRGGCSYAVRSHEPTGLLVVDAGTRLRLGDLFAVWGQPLSRRRLASFAGLVEAYVGGHRWPGPPPSIPLRRHDEIVLEVGGHVPPHPRYRFPPGL